MFLGRKAGKSGSIKWVGVFSGWWEKEGWQGKVAGKRRMTGFKSQDKKIGGGKLMII